MVEDATRLLSRRHFLTGLGALTCFGQLSSLLVPVQAAGFDFAPFSFAVVSDSHLSHGLPDSLKLLQESQLFLQDVVKSINEQKVDFVIFCGDQVETPGRDETYWQLFIDIVAVLNCPWYFVLGEWDVSGPPAVERMITYGPDFKGKGLTGGTSYWSTDPVPGVHLVGLDTAKANSETGELSNAQMNWLKQDLNSNKGKLTIVVSHHPLLAPPPYDGGPPFEEYTLVQGASAREILGACLDVRLAISGHVPINKIQRERSIWYVSCPPVDIYPCEYKLFHVDRQGITVETLGVRYEALVKKAKKIMINSRLAFQYSNHKPDTFLKLAEGGELDRAAYLGLAPGAVAQRLGKIKDKRNGKNKDPKQKNGKPKEAKEKTKKKIDSIPEEPKKEQAKSDTPDLVPEKQDSLPAKDSDQNKSGEEK
ncbi:metallophosphoesterase [bacterium]|nr:metallophosphoesterase [bacterium]MBP9810705.1 metallophosphoesterase [bacterium]